MRAIVYSSNTLFEHSGLRSQHFPIARQSYAPRRPLPPPVGASYRVISGTEDPSDSSSSGTEPLKLMIYSRSDCPMCTILESRLKAAVDGAGFLPGAERLVGATVEVRDIKTNDEWRQRYELIVPVIVRVLPDGAEVDLPRLPVPKPSVEKLVRHLAAVIKD